MTDKDLTMNTGTATVVKGLPGTGWLANVTWTLWGPTSVGTKLAFAPSGSGATEQSSWRPLGLVTPTSGWPGPAAAVIMSNGTSLPTVTSATATHSLQQNWRQSTITVIEWQQWNKAWILVTETVCPHQWMQTSKAALTVDNLKKHSICREQNWSFYWAICTLSIVMTFAGTSYDHERRDVITSTLCVVWNVEVLLWGSPRTCTWLRSTAASTLILYGLWGVATPAKVTLALYTPATWASNSTRNVLSLLSVIRTGMIWPWASVKVTCAAPIHTHARTHAYWSHQSKDATNLTALLSMDLKNSQVNK